VAISGPFNAADYDYCNVAVYDPSGPRPEMFTKPVSLIVNGDADNAYFAQNGSTSDLSLFRLLVTSNGIALDKQLNSIATNFGAALAYANGYLYNDGGTIWTADTTHIAGSVATDPGFPIPFPDRNLVVYVSIPDLSGIQVTAFDLTTFRPTASLFIPERLSDFSLSAIRAGSGAIAFIDSQELLVVPLTALQPVPSLQAALQTVAPGVQKSSIPAYAIAAQPGTANLLVATPSTAFNFGNDILAMDPTSGSVLTSIFAGSEPSLLAVSGDGTFAYSYLGGAGNLARFNLAAGTRDLVFSGDLTGQGQPVGVWDLCVGPDGGLAVSYVGGPVAIFDGGVPRLRTDLNENGFADFSANFQLAFNAAGTMMYGYDQWVSSWDLKSWTVSDQGVAPRSLAPDLTNSYYTSIRSANGLLYSSIGDVIDPERSRDVGQFQYPGLNHLPDEGYHPDSVVYPDTDTGRVYFLYGGKVLVFDMNTYALLGSLDLPAVTSDYVNLVKWSGDGLAFNTVFGDLYLIQISAIPLNPNPVAPPPVYSLPRTSGVGVLDLTVKDLVYDASRDRIYASIPASEGALADTIVAIDPSQASVTGKYPAGVNPVRLAISDDDSQLYFAMGMVNNGLQYVGQGLRRFDLASGRMTHEFAAESNKGGGYISSIPDLTVLPGEPHSVAIVSDFGVVTLYDDSTPRAVSDNASGCSSIQPGATASRLYGYDGNSSNFAFSRLAVDSTGVKLVDSSGPDLIGAFGVQILFHGGRVYTTNGRIIDPEAYRLLGTVQAKGPVAVDGNVTYWLDTGSTTAPSMLLRAFDATTFAPLYTRAINVGSTTITRLIPCGQGRLAFGAGHQVFIVYPQN
jgi:hypothetical protein